MPSPLISVLMAVHNGERFLRKSIESILNQTFTDFEFIIVDDGSSDHSPAIIAEYAEQDRRIVVKTNPEPLFLAAALNVGLDAARGKYIARHDDDDIAVSDRLEIQYGFLENHPEFFLCGGQAVSIDEKDTHGPLVCTELQELPLRKKLEAGQNNIIHPSIMFHAEGGLRYRGHFVNAQDYDLYLRAYAAGLRLINLPRILLFYRQNTTQKLILSKVIRQKLLNCAARRFYRERLENGHDEYDHFDFSRIKQVDPEHTVDSEILQYMLDFYFARNDGNNFRKTFFRLRQVAAVGRRMWGKFAVTLLPDVLWQNLRRLTRREKKIWPEIVLLASTGSGIADWERIGSSGRELGIYRNLNRHGWRTDFMTYDDATRRGETPFPGISVYPLLFFHRLRGKFNAWYGELLPWLRHELKHRVSLIVTNQSHSGRPAIRMGRVWQVPVLARSGYLAGRNVVFRGEENTATGRATLAREAFVMRHADHCFITTAEQQQWVSVHYPVAEEKKQVVPNYIDLKLFAPIPGIGKDIDVLCVGRVAQEKNYQLLLDAAVGTDWKITIIGGGDATGIQVFAERNRIDLQIIPRIPNEELPIYLNRASVYVICSQYEGHPKSLSEAMSCGCACVGTETPGIANQIINGETGLLCKPDSMDLQQAVRQLLGDQEQARRMGKAARDYACRNFDFNMLTGIYEETFLNLILQCKYCR